MTTGHRGRPRGPLAIGPLLIVTALAAACGSDSGSPTEESPTPTPVATPAGGGAVGSLVEVPDPLSGDNPVFRVPSVTAPSPGQAVDDAAFGTRQTRVTSALGLRNEYSRHDAFNSDRSLILLLDIDRGEFRAYRTQSVPYDRDGNLLRTVDLEEPRWDPSRPTLLWGTRDFRIETLDVETGASVVVKDFAADPSVAPALAANPDVYRVTMRDEGESSSDKRYWAFLLQGSADDYRGRFILSWDRDADRVLGLMPISAAQSDIDWVGMSPLGRYVLIGGSDGNAAPLTGLVMADRALTAFQRIDWATAHADVGLDSSGAEVVVMQNARTDYVDLIPLDPATRPILDAGGSYEGTNRTPLLRLYYASSPSGFGGGVHVSCNVPGYCVVSTHIDAGVPEQNWLDRKIVLVRLDRSRPRTYYLAHIYGSTGAYWEETHATVSRDGSRVVWATNWGQQAGAERVWLMELQMPAGWQQTLR